jgi:hypothetical protein
MEISNTKVYKLLFKIYCKIKFTYRNRIISDSKSISISYRRAFGVKPDLKNPKTLNEKIQWLKLHDRTDLHTLCADKYKVREYVKNKIGSQYLIPLLYETKNVDDIKPENLPDTPFIIKTNHDSSGGIIVKDKNAENWESIRERLRILLKSNYYINSKEWQYKNIERRIIVEELLVSKESIAPYDYKVHCFNKKSITIQVDIDRHDQHKRNWYSTDWKREPFHWSSLKANNKRTIPADFEIKRPEYLDKLLLLSEKLCEDFIYARADWYIIEEKIYFGEISYHHDGGLHPIVPKEWDLKLGQKLKLPIDA